MKKRYSGTVVGIAIAGWFGISGCAPAQPPVENFMSGPVAQSASSGARAGGIKSARSSSENLPLGGQQQSSLDALRRGDAPTRARDSAVREIYFTFDRYDLDAEDRATLQATAEWLKKNPAARIEIEGHCDERGTTEYNLALGAKRAQSAQDYLSSLGIAKERISMISYGEEIPVCRSQTEDCWQKNRRDHFVTLAGRPTS